MKIRHKIYALSVSLLIFPAMGYYYVWQTEQHLRSVTNQELQSAACDATKRLSQRPALFSSQAAMAKVDDVSRSFIDMMDSHDTLDAFILTNPYITHESLIHRWLDIYKGRTRHFNKPFFTDESVKNQPNSIQFDYIAAKDSSFLYAIFHVFDDQFIGPTSEPQSSAPDPDKPRLFIGDHIQVITEDPRSGLFRRNILTLVENHSIISYQVPLLGVDLNYPPVENFDFIISGHWEKTDYGYGVKLRIPLNFFSDRITFAVGDADSRNGPVKTLISTTSPSGWNNKNETLLQAMNLPEDANRRALVLNDHGQVIGIIGAIETSEPDSLTHRMLRFMFGEYGYSQLPRTERGELINQSLRPEVYQALHATASPIERAKQQTFKHGAAYAGRYQGDFPHLAIHAVVCPLFIETQAVKPTLVGAVIMEKVEPMVLTSNRTDILQMLVITLSTFVVVTFTLWRVASTLSRRLNRLRREVEQGLGTAGNVQPEKIYVQGSDELAELARSFSALLGNLSEHYRYLQDMAGRLAHELRTPITVVRLSLENLGHAADANEREIYMKRANEGLERLHTLIQCLTESSRIEQAMQHAEKEIVDLVEFLRGCTESYRMIYPDQVFLLELPSSPLTLNCSPDLLAQMLDKLISNAVDFAKPDTPIEIRLRPESRFVRIEVGNQGKTLPKEFRKRIFDSMISLRDKTGKTTEPHLGLGLYIVRIIVDFHHGTISAGNHPMGGALFRIHLPFARTELSGPTVMDGE